ncbi:MAG: esterase/lipase family protein [Pseudonocardiaceae bacterium]
MAPHIPFSRLPGATALVNRLEVLPGLAGQLLTDTGPLARLSASLKLPFYQEVRILAGYRAMRSHPLWHNPPAALGGLPVLVVGGLASSPRILGPMQDWLQHIGARTLLAPTQYGIACGERTAAAVTDALARHVDATGERAVIVAHSRGGQFARPIAVRRPDLVRGLITLGSPLTRLLGAHPIVLLEVLGLGVLGSLGIPGLIRASCLWGECCRQLRDDLVGPFPADVPFVSVYSRNDEVVPWQASLDPAARYREVSTTHSGLIASPATFELLAQELVLLVDRSPDADLAVAS